MKFVRIENAKNPFEVYEIVAKRKYALTLQDGSTKNVSALCLWSLSSGETVVVEEPQVIVVEKFWGDEQLNFETVRENPQVKSVGRPKKNSDA